MTSWGLLDVLEQMIHFLSTSLLCMCECASLWVCCVSHSPVVVWRRPEWLRSLLTWKEGWLCNELSKLPQNSADNSPSLPPCVAHHTPAPCLFGSRKVGQDFPLRSFPLLFFPCRPVRACMSSLSLLSPPPLSWLLTYVRKKKESESRTGYTGEKHYITSRMLLFIEGSWKFSFDISIWMLHS